MNKTVTINISGIIFHIEEDAFDALSAYLGSIKNFFRNTEGGSEIMGDIEARIAELLQASTGPAKQVIVMADVQNVVQVMGKPEDFGAGEEREASKGQQQTAAPQAEKIKRRLFRNPDDKAIGGVCSGLAAYFDIDTVWVRLAMFLLTFFGGVSIWVYIVLWLVMPEARTTADKFAMRGEQANINTIFRSFQEEAEDVKTRFNKYGKEFRDGGYGAAVRNNVSTVLGTIFGILGRLFGFFLIIVGGILLFGYLVSLFGISVANDQNNLMHWKSVLFSSPADYTLVVFAFIFVVGIPVIMLVYAGVRLLFRIRYNNRWLNISLGTLWVIGLITGIYVTVVTLKQFSEVSKVKESVVLTNMSDTIFIKLNPKIAMASSEYDNVDEMESYVSEKQKGYFFGTNAHHLTVFGIAQLNVSVGESDSVELITTHSARGLDKREANVYARQIKYHYKQEGNTLIFDKNFIIEEDAKWRKQEVKLKLKVPVGRVICFDKNVKYFLDEIDNTTNTWDGNLAGRRWIMTEQGLKCIDCKDLDDDDDDDEHGIHTKDGNVTINENGIHVKDRDTEVKIDEDGIRIKTPDKDVKIDGEGVREKKR